MKEREAVVVNQNMMRVIKENRCVRVLAYPFEQLRRQRRLKRYQQSEDAQYIRSLKGTHKGERCFVIGNGPSLTPEDLDTLHEHNIFCFAANRIYKIYPKTIWRPSIYLALDTFFIADAFDEFRSAGEYPKIVNYNSEHFGRQSSDNIHYLCVHEPFKLDPYQLPEDTLSDDPSKYSVKVGTVTVSSIELAIYMGFEQIYLLGVDNNYVHKRKADGTVYADPTVKASYFQGAEPGRSIGPSVQPTEYLEKTYEVSKHFADAHGVNVYNATRGGKLEVFERVDFDSLFGRQ